MEAIQWETAGEVAVQRPQVRLCACVGYGGDFGLDHWGVATGVVTSTAWLGDRYRQRYCRVVSQAGLSPLTLGEDVVGQSRYRRFAHSAVSCVGAFAAAPARVA